MQTLLKDCTGVPDKHKPEGKLVCVECSCQACACKAVMTGQNSLLILLYRSLIYTTLHHDPKEHQCVCKLNTLLHAKHQCVSIA